MNQVSRRIEESSNTTLGVLFSTDVYGYAPRYIDFILPNGNAFDFQTKPINGWNFTGDIITIKNDTSNGNLIWRFNIYENDEAKNNRTWMNHSIVTKAANLIFAIAYY